MGSLSKILEINASFLHHDLYDALKKDQAQRPWISREALQQNKDGGLVEASA